MYLHVLCNWGLLKSSQGREILANLHHAARKLDATVFNPQLAEPIVEEGREAPRGALDDLGPGRRVVHAKPDEDRAQSFGVVDTWSVSKGSTAAVHAFHVAAIADGFSARHSYHPKNLAELACEYVRIVQDVLPFEMVAAGAVGRAADGGRVGFGNRVFAILEGRIWTAALVGDPVAKAEDRSLTSVWLNAPRVASVDATPLVDAAARKALALAHEGRTRPLRDWMALMVSLHASGHAVEELFAHEVAPGDDVATAFEAFDSGAVMPVWSQRMSGACFAEVRLRLPERGSFALKVIDRGFGAPQRHTFAPPLGPFESR
jgi:hypothetical protein